MTHPFYADLPPETAEHIERLSRLSHELRRHRNELLERHGAGDAEALLGKVRSGEVAEHPGYDHYLSVRILEQTREAVRSELGGILQGRPPGEEGAASTPPLHLALREDLAARYRDRLAGEVEMRQDAMLLHLDNGVSLEVRYASPEEYGLHWVWGEAEMRLDTAPVHDTQTTAPLHLHDSAGQALDGLLTTPGAPPLQNLQALIDALLEDPLLARG